MKIFKNLIILRATLLSGSVAFGQLNESDTARIQFKWGINGIRQTGNVDLGILRSRLEAVYHFGQKWVAKSQNNSLYQEIGPRKADQDINSRNYLYFMPNRRFYPFAMAFWQQNFRLKIDDRFFTGAGATIQLVRSQNHFLKFSASLVYEETRYATRFFNQTFYQKNVISIWRPTLYLTGGNRFTHNKIRLFYSGYWQPGLDQVSNQRFQGEVGLEFSLWKGFNLSAQYWYLNEEIVPLKIKQTDGLFTAGITFQFKK